MKPIRVLQVFTVLNRGGAETMIMNYYRHIDRTKVQFDFLVHREKPGVYEEEIKALGGRIYRLSAICPGNFKKYKEQVKHFFDQHTEYKIIHGHFSELGYFLYREAYRHNVPVIICHAHNSKMSLDLKAPFRWYWKHTCRKYVTHPFTCSKASAIWLFGEKIGEQAIRMNNAVDREKLRFDKEISRQLRKDLGIENKMVLGHVGRFNKQKNHRFLIQMFSEVIRKEPDSVLLLIGEGELENEVKQQVKSLGIEKNIRFLGSRSDVNQLLMAMDLFVFPSLFEGLPVTLIEAQATGLPCLISEKISKDVDMKMKLIHYLPITKVDDWIEAIQVFKGNIENAREERITNNSKIKEQRYDIKEETKVIQQFYLEHAKEGAEV